MTDFKALWVGLGLIASGWGSSAFASDIDGQSILTLESGIVVELDGVLTFGPLPSDALTEIDFSSVSGGTGNVRYRSDTLCFFDGSDDDEPFFSITETQCSGPSALVRMRFPNACGQDQDLILAFRGNWSATQPTELDLVFDLSMTGSTSADAKQMLFSYTPASQTMACGITSNIMKTKHDAAKNALNNVR